MAIREVTLAQLRDRLEKLCNIENLKHLKEEEKNAIIASAVAETWDKIISSGSQNLFVKSVTFNSVAGQLEYDLAATGMGAIITDGDFYKIHQLYIDENSGQRRPLPKLNPAEIQAFRPPQSVVPVILYYVP